MENTEPRNKKKWENSSKEQSSLLSRENTLSKYSYISIVCLKCNNIYVVKIV